MRAFLENNLGLSKDKKIQVCIVKGHNEALHYWKKLIDQNKLCTPFEVIHIDSHADLGLGYTSWKYITHELLGYPVKERYEHAENTRINVEKAREGIGDYLLFASNYSERIIFLYTCTKEILKYRIAGLRTGKV